MRKEIRGRGENSWHTGENMKKNVIKAKERVIFKVEGAFISIKC